MSLTTHPITHPDIFTHILPHCSRHTLATLCATSQQLSALVLPLLYSHLKVDLTSANPFVPDPNPNNPQSKHISPLKESYLRLCTRLTVHTHATQCGDLSPPLPNLSLLTLLVDSRPGYSSLFCRRWPTCSLLSGLTPRRMVVKIIGDTLPSAIWLRPAPLPPSVEKVTLLIRTRTFSTFELIDYLVFQQMPGTVRQFDIVILPPKGCGGVWEAQKQYYGDVYWYLFDRLCVNLAKLACREVPQVGFWGLGCVEPKCVGMSAGSETDTTKDDKGDQVQLKVAERIRLELSNLGGMGAVRFGSLDEWKEQNGWQEAMEGEEVDEPGAAGTPPSPTIACPRDVLAAWDGW